MPALNANANGDYYETGAGFTMPTSAGTYATWFYPTSITARQVLSIHTGTDSGLNWRADLAGKAFNGYRGGATYATAGADATAFAAYLGANNWHFLAFTWSGSASKLYMGNRATPPAEPSSYSGGTTIIATPTTTTSALRMMNDKPTTTRWLNGRMAMYAVYPRALAQFELYQLWKGVQLPAATGFWLPGMNGTTNVPDYSGNGWTGTITSLDLADGPPVLMPWQQWHEEGADYMVAAAPAGGQPTTKRWSGVPGMRIGGAAFGQGWGY